MNAYAITKEEDTNVIDTPNNIMSINDFIANFSDNLIEKVAEQLKPIFVGVYSNNWDVIMDSLTRKPFDKQREVIASIATLLFTHNQPAGVINAEMGTGKTMMAISLAAIAAKEGYSHSIVISPPHLVYKWRREILDTIADVNVVILNGPDALSKLVKLRENIKQGKFVKSNNPTFFIIGRVRMRMGFHWSGAFMTKNIKVKNKETNKIDVIRHVQVCPDCHQPQYDKEGNIVSDLDDKKRFKCQSCNTQIWQLHRSKQKAMSKTQILEKALCQIPTIGKKTANKLLKQFGNKTIEGMLADNIYEFVNLIDDNGNLVFSDKKAIRIERGLAKLEFGFGQGGYQPTEFIKRYLPNNFFNLLIVDEGHEYKNGNSAQGQAMGVLASKVDKVLLLTGTLMGGYASDLFYLLWRLNPQKMLDCGYIPSHKSISKAAMSFMRDHGVLKDVFKIKDSDSFKTARGKKTVVSTLKSPGFSPQGIVEHILPITAFLKLSDLGQDVLPDYKETIIDVDMSNEQAEIYSHVSSILSSALKKSLSTGDNSLLGVVLNVLLRWSDTAFRNEKVIHPRKKDLLLFQKAIFDQNELMPKEEALVKYVITQKELGRKVLVYTIYTGNHDTASRLKTILESHFVKTAVLRSTIGTDKREDWIIDQVDKGIDVMICNPDLVKTGLDLLDFPSIVFMQTGYNVYTVQQASRRSLRIGQKNDVEVVFMGYKQTTQISCMELMGEKISISQSTSGDIPDNGLDSLNQGDESIELALAKQLIKK